MHPLRIPESVALVVAAFSRHPQALEWARGKLVTAFGPVALASDSYEFHHTSYYEAEMGSGLRKKFWVFENLVSPDCLADVKSLTNAVEAELAANELYIERRPLNLDPGVLSLGKFLLATTKDQSHRIYLRDGIFAEVTLRFRDHTFEPWLWTYADYREPAVIDFLNAARQWYRERFG